MLFDDLLERVLPSLPLTFFGVFYFLLGGTFRFNHRGFLIFLRWPLLFCNRLGFLHLGVSPPMFFLLADAGVVVLEAGALEIIPTIDTNERARAAGTPDVPLALLLLEGRIAVLTNKCDHGLLMLLIIRIWISKN